MISGWNSGGLVEHKSKQIAQCLWEILGNQSTNRRCIGEHDGIIRNIKSLTNRSNRVYQIEIRQLTVSTLCKE
jgi:hypothetical protein